MATRKPSAPPRPAPSDEGTATLPALRPAEPFIGHDAKTRAVPAFKPGRAAPPRPAPRAPQPTEGRTTTGPVYEPEEKTPPPEEEVLLAVALLSVEALEVLAGQRLPARLRRFFQSEEDGYQHRVHPQLAKALTFRPRALSAAWSRAKGRAGSRKLVPIALAGEGADAVLLVVDLTSAAFEVLRSDPAEGFSRLAATFDEFLLALVE